MEGMRRALTTIRRLLWAIFHASQRPFMVNGHRDTPLLLLFLLINVLMSINVVLHHPMIGYDAVAHLRYVQALAEFRLPTAADTKEFFLPPLPYVLGAIAHHFIAPWCTAAGIGEGWGITAIPPCLVVAGKVAQLQNIPLSLGTTWGLVAISHLFAPNDVGYKRVVLGALGMLPVYYKTFAFVRGEPFLVCITVLVLLFTLRLLLNRPTSNRWRYILLLGAMLGLLLLSRQWGVFLPAAVGMACRAMASRPLAIARPLCDGIYCGRGGYRCGADWWVVLHEPPPALRHHNGLQPAAGRAFFAWQSAVELLHWPWRGGIHTPSYTALLRQ